MMIVGPSALQADTQGGVERACGGVVGCAVLGGDAPRRRLSAHLENGKRRESKGGRARGERGGEGGGGGGRRKEGNTKLYKIHPTNRTP
jgi:hypothetical protein